MSNSYSHDELSIESIERQDNGSTKIVYSTILETLYYCPGANVTEKKDGIHIEFVRCPIDDLCNVTHPLKLENDKEYIVIEDVEKKLYLKTKNDLIKI
ncbi:hypothetical protein [Motiliproteus sp. MSK22-1]|uniref:hypothetical protein n=1 Tax=Motiliproteus sp. MSK22-1 TaxID=1897630 RepID=UPI00117EE57D|nr:hypothetical protein [Motiliproteus sp. MSK22-1]